MSRESEASVMGNGGKGEKEGKEQDPDSRNVSPSPKGPFGEAKVDETTSKEVKQKGALMAKLARMVMKRGKKHGRIVSPKRSQKEAKFLGSEYEQEEEEKDSDYDGNSEEEDEENEKKYTFVKHARIIAQPRNNFYLSTQEYLLNHALLRI